MLPEVSAIMRSSSRQTAMLQERRGKTSETATSRWHDPTKPVQNPFWKHRAQLRIPGFAKRRGLEEGVPCHPALFPGATLHDPWPAASSESTGHSAGQAHVTRPLLPAGVPSLALARAGGQRTGHSAAAGTDSDRALTAGARSFSGVLLSLPHTSASEGPGHSPRPLRCKAATARSVHGNVFFFPELRTLPTALSRREERNP